jgi:hypothetical protein
MSRLLLACAAVAALLAAGCATAQIEPKYRSRSAQLPPDPAAPAVFVEVPDADVAPLHFKNGGATRSARFTTPFGPFLRETLSQELARMGLRAAPSRADADGVLRAAASKLSVVYKTFRFNHLGFVADVTLSLTLSDRAGTPLWSGDFVGAGKSESTTPGLPGDAPEDAFREALGEALDKVRPSLEVAQVFARLGGARPAAVAARPAAPAPAAAPRSDIEALPAQASARAAHAVVIGVENYRESLPRADFAASDARLAAEYFKRALGVPAENVALLTDDRATNSDLQKYFERWLPNRVKAGDEVFVYFSGHGSPNAATGDAYLVPYDGDPTYLDQTAYPLKRLYEQLAKLPAKRVVVAMDSCFSGAGGRSVLAKGARPLVTAVAASALPASVTVISASAGDQISNSYQEKGHGLFTYYFLKGLKEKGGADLRAVYGYLKPEVARVAREQYNADQDPQWREGK